MRYLFCWHRPRFTGKAYVMILLLGRPEPPAGHTVRC
jgi:hypothetical protein